ncbi:MAG: ATP-binding protein [Clostridia bacterium]|nr:ATP-binding protein [Clostridia bacterium]
MDTSLIKTLTISKETLPVITDFAECMSFGFLIYTADKSSRIVCANSKLAELCGCSSVDEFMEFSKKSYKNIVIGNLEKFSRDPDNTVTNTYRIRKKDGSDISVTDLGYSLKSDSFGDLCCAYIRDFSEEDLEKQRNTEIIEVLASEYSSVYYIDLRTDELNPYTMNEETETTFGSVFRSGITYSEAYKLYVDKLILPEDKNMMLNAGSIENIRKQLANKKTFITQYRSSDNHYNEMKFVKVGGDNDEPVSVALGFADKDDEIRLQLAIELERQRNTDIIEILASEYSSVYYIDLRTDELNPYTMNEETETTFGSVFRSGITYSEAYKLYVDKLILPEDKKMMLDAGSVENIRKQLANKKTFITQYRSSDNHYNEMKFVKVGGDNDEPVSVALGFADKDEEIRIKMSEEQAKQRNFDIIGILASEYSSVYYIDLRTDELNPYTMNEETETTFGSVFRSGITYSEAYKLYVDKLILPEDKKMMLNAGSVENIKEQLANKKTFITQYRSSDNHYNEMKFVKVGGDNDEPVSVALGFADKDDEIRRQLAIELERQRNTDIIEILASEYSSVYYIDLRTDELNPYTMNEETETTFGSVFRSGITYSEAYKLYVDKLILSEDKKMMLNAGSIENIRKQLANKKTFITQYRSSDNHYNEMKFVKVGGDNDEPVSVALGFADKDEEIRQQLAIELEKQRNYDIIEILASEYSSVYYIDLTTDELDPYTMNEETESEFGKIFRSGIKYSAAFRMYVDQLILPADKSMMLKAGSIGNIMKELTSKKTFITTYRNSEGHYSEMKFVKVGNEEGLPTAVALGFADKDEEIRAREEEQQKLQRNIDIIEILASEYSSVYYIDLTTDELDPYTMNEETESEFGSVFRSGIHYSDAFKLYVDTLVNKNDKKRMLNSGSIYNILKELRTKKTFITTYQNSQNHYCEMKFVKVGDEENPQAVALGFADKDQEIRSEIKRKESAERDAAVIQGLADDFGCIIYASYEDFEEVQYRIDPLFEKNIPGWTKINKFDERLDKLIGTIMHPDDREVFRAATRSDVVRKAVERDNVYFVNFRTLINGEITYYQCKFAKDEQHKDTHVIAGFHNVDAETKREMDALDRANSASKAKTDFLFNMSHDIRTPMNAIIGFTNIAMKEIENKEKALENLNKVKMSSDMLLSLINDILDMSRIESGKVTLNTEKFSLDQTFGKIEPVMGNLAVQKDINLSFELKNIKDNYVLADVPRINRVLVNLISNAIKYTGCCGKIWVTLEQIDNKNGTGFYRYTVKDTGFGMSEEFQKHMFEEFAREETSTNSGIQGTGLGLALAQKLVVLMNGTIECQSKLGVGTTFTITLPLQLQSKDEIIESKLDSETQSVEVLKNKRILLVDDNELNREIATYNLEEEGVIVETAVDGKNALETVISKGNGYYDAILMDIQMPVMDGYESTAEIRKAIPDLTAPIIALSANAFEEDRKKSMESGMNEHIAKPINMAQLNKVLTKFLG